MGPERCSISRLGAGDSVPRTLWPSLPAAEVSGPESPELCGAGKAPGSSRRVAKGKTVGRGSSLGGGLAELRRQGMKAFPGEWEEVMAEMF